MEWKAFLFVLRCKGFTFHRDSQKYTEKSKMPAGAKFNTGNILDVASLLADDMNTYD